MGWNTSLLTRITFHKKTYDCYAEIERDMDESKSLINLAKEDLFALAISENNQLFKDPQEDGSAYDAVRAKYRNAIEILEEELPRLLDLHRIHAAMEKATYKGRDGKTYFKPEPKGVEWNDSFIDGDFIPHEDIVETEDQINDELLPSQQEFLQSLPAQFKIIDIARAGEGGDTQAKTYANIRNRLLKLEKMGYITPTIVNSSKIGYTLTDKALKVKAQTCK